MRPRFPEQLWAIARLLYQKQFFRLARVVKTLNWFLHKCLLPAEAQVGKNLCLEHYALGIVMHPQITIGNDCRIYHHVTFAAESAIGSPHRIVLGNRTTIGAHSIVIARSNSSLHIGENSTLGAGSVLTKDIPPNEVWAGNPARKIRDRKGDEG